MLILNTTNAHAMIKILYLYKCTVIITVINIIVCPFNIGLPL